MYELGTGICSNIEGLSDEVNRTLDESDSFGYCSLHSSLESTTGSTLTYDRSPTKSDLCITLVDYANLLQPSTSSCTQSEQICISCAQAPPSGVHHGSALPKDDRGVCKEQDLCTGSGELISELHAVRFRCVHRCLHT